MVFHTANPLALASQLEVAPTKDVVCLHLCHFQNEPMKFFFRIMEKSAAEKMENSDTIEQDIFVKPVKPVRNIERTKSNRSEFKKKITPVSSPEKKIDEDKNDVIINTDKIKDEIKNKLQDIGKGPVYTNITLNRSNNVEIITKVQKVSNKNGQPIGLNIIKQTVKKTNRLPEKINDKLTEKPTQITNGCKPDVRLKKEQNDIRIEKVIKKDVKIIIKKETKQEAKSKPDRDLSNISPANIKSELKTENKIKLETDIVFIKKEDFIQNLSNKENQREQIEPEQTIKEEIEPEVPTTEKNEETNVVIQTTVEKKEFDIDEEKSNFLKSIELTARTALQTIQGLKAPLDKPNQSTTSPKSTQKRKNSSPVKNDKKKPKKTKNSPIKLPSSSVDKIMLLAEKHKNGDLQSLFTSCKINIPSSLSITLKESSEDDRDRRNAASLKPVQNYIEILKLPDSNPSQLEKTDVENRFKSKSAPNLPCKISVVSSKDQKQQLQTFQKMFEDSLKKIELNSKINLTPNNNHLKSNTPEESTQNNSTKRNLMEIASQLHKKTKLEAEKPAQKNDSLPKIPIPRLNIQRKSNNQLKFQQTIANLHSASLGLNYTVSVAQNSNKSPGGKIGAKVENSIKTPVKIDESVRVEEAQNLTKKEDKIEEHKTNGRITVPNFQNFSNQPTNLVKNHSPRTNSTKPQAPVRQPNISPNISPRSNISPVPPHIASPRPKTSPEKPLVNSGTAQNLQAASAFSPNHILEKYNIQNLAQLTANLNFNSGMFGMNHTSQLAALQQAMLLKQFELHNRQNWQLSNQYEKYIQNRLLSKEN
ncbi:hypothetical protein MML48_9g00005236 [Holotrichia oblita]|uniref:Uncharacterized protein n=1 Tax=Holotrichia oblita TaxID=644536 RepID=A0ACB9SGP9_HOLOL|nr:hypothetical protein MML48_9g00005236 [Holotrichia oblita]